MSVNISANKKDFSVKYLSDPGIMYLSENRHFKTARYPSIDPKSIFLLRIDEICSEEKAPQKEALENVLSAMRIEGINFVYLIIGDRSGVHFYYGVAEDSNYGQTLELSIADICEKILQPSIQGNYRGSMVTPIDPDEKRSLIKKIHCMKYSGILEGVPGVNKDDEKFQSVDRMVDVMQGDEFVFMVIAKPLNLKTVLEIQNDLYQLYSEMVPLSKQSVQSASSTNIGYSKGITKGTSESSGSNENISNTDGKSSTTGSNYTTTKSTSSSTTESGSSKSTSNSGSKGENEGTSTSVGTSESKSFSKGTSTSTSNSVSGQETNSEGSSKSSSATIEFSNKEIQDWIKYLDEVLIPRLDYGKGKGVYAVNIAMLTNNKASLCKLENTAISLYAGETGNRVPLKAMVPDNSHETAIRNFQLPYGKLRIASDRHEKLAHTAMSQVIDASGSGYIGNWITTNEMSVVTGLPQKEVVGLRLKEEVEFGLNSPQLGESKSKIELGKLVQSGNILDNQFVYLDKNVLDQHIFIAGVTGSGKTTTCQNLIHAAELPFLVIEPAKTEYRILKEKYPDLLVFTLGKNTVAPLKLNPFVFYPHESITSRVDMIKACIESAFDMEAAIPQIIEAAIYQSYEDFGWDINTNNNRYFPNRNDAFRGGSNAFPTLDDLLKNCAYVVENQGFDERLKNDYIGSIRARLLGLCVGGKGQMLNTHHSVDFTELLEHRVVLELEEVRSSSEKALIMGFILINLNEAIKAKYLKEGKFRHLTLVEEAHRLLSKYQPGDDPNKKHGVEMFTDMLAEIRKYGESLIIVDQIPNKLTPEVLKNTNTKIIHRLFAADDKDAVGNTVMLSKEQKEFLSNLEAGRAVYFSNGLEKAVQVQMKMQSDTSSIPPSDNILIENAHQFYRKRYFEGYISGLELFDSEPDEIQFCSVKKLDESNVMEHVLELCRKPDVNEHIEMLRTQLEEYVSTLGIPFLASYLNKYTASDLLLSETEGASEWMLCTIMQSEFPAKGILGLKRLLSKL